MSSKPRRRFIPRRNVVIFSCVYGVGLLAEEAKDFYLLLRKILCKLINLKNPQFEYLLREVGLRLIMCKDEVYPLLADYKKHCLVPLELLELIKKILNDLDN